MVLLKVLLGTVLGFIVGALTGFIVAVILVTLFYDGPEGAAWRSGAAGIGYLVMIGLMIIGPIVGVRIAVRPPESETPVGVIDKSIEGAPLD